MYLCLNYAQNNGQDNIIINKKNHPQENAAEGLKDILN